MCHVDGKIEASKAAFEKQTTHIVKDMRTELNARNVDGDLCKAGCVLDEIISANAEFLGKLQDLTGTNIWEDGPAEVKSEDYFVLNDDYVEEEEMEELEGCTIGSSPPVSHTAVNHIKGLNIFGG